MNKETTNTDLGKIKAARLLVFDFDGNLANTFVPSPNGTCVESAYNYALNWIFGNEFFHRRPPLDVIGGLQSRAPSEIIMALLEKIPRAKFIDHARQFVTRNALILKEVVPDDQASLITDFELHEGIPQTILIERLAELLVRTKLVFLLNEINKEWPLPFPGVVDFFEQLARAQKNGSEIQTAILSSGHTRFIQKWFQVFELSLPQIMVTDDDLRGLAEPADPKQRMKPSPFLMDLVHLRWLEVLGISRGEQELSKYYLPACRAKTIYFGDDTTQDLQLAINSGVEFCWLA